MCGPAGSCDPTGKDFRRPLKVENEHSHSKDCEDFSNALKFGHLIIIKNEIQIKGTVPKDAKIGNVITNETYNPGDFCFNMVIKYCPFCGVELDG
jgi:hypothetical protein